MGWPSRENYRWDPSAYPTVIARSIDVSGPTKEAAERRADLIRSGARVVPFGFGIREDVWPKDWLADG